MGMVLKANNMINRENLLKLEVSSALYWVKAFKFFRIGLAITVAVAYSQEFSFLTELLVFSVLLLLVFPMGFFDAFFEKHLEYNTVLLEDRQKLNAEEANEYFTKAFNEIEDIKEYLDLGDDE